MCGIAGYFGTRAIDPARIDETLARMRRRGPDHAEWRRFEGPAGRMLTLLHSRLNIIDLDARSNQPFQDGSHSIAFNGELYNYLEVRESLAREGHSFHTTSDTEVLLRVLKTRGVDALDECEGMWAFACYDGESGRLLLSRDRFGEKPLYLFRDNDGLYFGSEIKFLAALSGRRFEVDLDNLYRYLVNGYKDLYKGNRSFFRGVTELPAASLLEIDAEGRERERRYWEPAFSPCEDMSYPEAVAGVRERLIDAVRIRLRADVPLAFCMSGGVDSNALISIAKRTFGYDVHGFTIASEDERYEESDMVAHVVQALGLRHTSIPTRVTEFLPRLRALIRQHDAPVYTITYYAHWLLMEQIAAHGYRISVSGTAADELFSGYYDHHLAYLYEVHREPALHAASVSAWSEHIKPIVRNPFLSNPDLFIEDPGFRDHIFLDAESFADYLTRPWQAPFHERHFTDSLLRNRMLNEMFHEAVPVILHEDDLNAMYYSIENRSPYLDRRLFDYCYAIPSRHLIQEGRAKAVLRDAMRGIVPDPVLDNRRKVGFNAPILDFLDVSDPEVRAWLVDASPIFEHVRRDKIEGLLEKSFLPNSQSKFLFYFVCAKMFLEEFAA
ncbi:MAG: asparagine synthase (glutamine-hydrolyzing) [Armatimonadetes bacterium]|nr:asparagine synthase (glutamine-hydrolyzing) [Armatimonadota bacterium]